MGNKYEVEIDGANEKLVSLAQKVGAKPGDKVTIIVEKKGEYEALVEALKHEGIIPDFDI